MFRLFGKKEEEKVFVTPDIKVQVLILSLMNTFLEQCKGDIVLVKEEPDVKKEYDRLVSLGLKNTENAKLLKAKIEEIQTKTNKSKFGQEVMEWVVNMKREFPNSYLISFDQFKKVLKDYGLITNFLRNYVGIIPSRNITEVEEVMAVVQQKRYDYGIINRLNESKTPDFQHYCHFYYVTGVRCRRGDEKKDCERIRERVEEVGNIIDVPSTSSYGVEGIRLDQVEEISCAFLPNGLKSGPFDDFTLTLERMDKTNLMIAAPRTCFSTEFKITEMPVDPIVFQCCPYGVIVHSVWGEEADDKVLKEYMELNQKILEV